MDRSLPPSRTALRVDGELRSEHKQPYKTVRFFDWLLRLCVFTDA